MRPRESALNPGRRRATALNSPYKFVAILAFTASGIGAARAGDLKWEGGVTALAQESDDPRVESELTASADLFMTMSQSRGEWLLYVEASTSPRTNGVLSAYPTANADAGSVLDRDGGSHIQVSELHYTFHMPSDRWLMTGLINPSAWLDRSRISNDENTQFINSSFKNNPTIEFPDYTLGALMRWPGAESRPEILLVVASSAGIADLPGRTYQELLSLSDDERGAFLGAEAHWRRDRAYLRAGSWLRTSDHQVAGRPDKFESNYGAYGVLGWQGDQDAVDIRAGVANDAVSVATIFVAAAWQRSMPPGSLGLGVATTRISNSLRRADFDDVSSAEVFFRLPVFGGAGHVTPSIQYVENPRFELRGASSSASATVVSVRFHWSFQN